MLVVYIISWLENHMDSLPNGLVSSPFSSHLIISPHVRPAWVSNTGGREKEAKSKARAIVNLRAASCSS